MEQDQVAHFGLGGNLERVPERGVDPLVRVLVGFVEQAGFVQEELRLATEAWIQPARVARVHHLRFAREFLQLGPAGIAPAFAAGMVMKPTRYGRSSKPPSSPRNTGTRRLMIAWSVYSLDS